MLGLMMLVADQQASWDASLRPQPLTLLQKLADAQSASMDPAPAAASATWLQAAAGLTAAHTPEQCHHRAAGGLKPRAVQPAQSAQTPLPACALIPQGLADILVAAGPGCWRAALR